jgi:HEPN domain-containing protein
LHGSYSAAARQHRLSLQQAIEKLLKGLLTLAGKRGGRTHLLERLAALVLTSFPDLADLLATARRWSERVTVYRYPEEDTPAEPDEVEIRTALAVIDALATRLKAANPEPQRRNPLASDRGTAAQAETPDRGWGVAAQGQAPRCREPNAIRWWTRPTGARSASLDAVAGHLVEARTTGSPNDAPNNLGTFGR